MFNISSVEKAYQSIAALNKNYHSLSTEQKKKTDSEVRAIMKQAEKANRHILQMKKQASKLPHAKSLDQILSSSEKFIKAGEAAAKKIAETAQKQEASKAIQETTPGSLGHIYALTEKFKKEGEEGVKKKESSEEKTEEKKEEAKEEKPKRLIEQAREQVKGMTDELKRKRDEQKKAEEAKDKEKGIFEKMEEKAMELTEAKRKELANGIQDRLGQGTLAKQVTDMVKKGHKFASDRNWIEKDSDVDQALNLAFEVNDFRNELVDEAVKLVLEPKKTFERYLQ